MPVDPICVLCNEEYESRDHFQMLLLSFYMEVLQMEAKIAMKGLSGTIRWDIQLAS